MLRPRVREVRGSWTQIIIPHRGGGECACGPGGQRPIGTRGPLCDPKADGTGRSVSRGLAGGPGWDANRAHRSMSGAREQRCARLTVGGSFGERFPLARSAQITKLWSWAGLAVTWGVIRLRTGPRVLGGVCVGPRYHARRLPGEDGTNSKFGASGSIAGNPTPPTSTRLPVNRCTACGTAATRGPSACLVQGNVYLVPGSESIGGPLFLRSGDPR